MFVRDFLKYISNSSNADKVAVIKMLIFSGIGISEDDQKMLLAYFREIQDGNK